MTSGFSSGPDTVSGILCPINECGEVAEWLMAPVLKTGIPERVSGVRIPPSPPLLLLSGTCKSVIPTLIPESGRITDGQPRSQPHKENRNAARVANGREERHAEERTTWNGVKARNEYASPWVSKQPTPTHGDCARKRTERCEQRRLDCD